jgi:hypothetical protein
MPPRAEVLRRAARWLTPAAALALMPKCLLCLLAYAGLGAALGLGGPEICGAPSGSAGSWMSSLALPGVVLLIIALAAKKLGPAPSRRPPRLGTRRPRRVFCAEYGEGAASQRPSQINDDRSAPAHAARDCSRCRGFRLARLRAIA